MNTNRIFFIVFGLALWAVAIYVWCQSSLSFPTRRGDQMTHFIGLAKFLFGLSPFLAGLAMLRNSTMPEVRKEPVAVALFLSGIVSMIISLLLAKKI